MLVARRDPPFDGDARDAMPTNLSAYPVRKASKLARFVTAIQLVGSLLAVPVGIASAYSFYRANFSPETTCQSLRSNIVAMLDKSVDAATRRVLVRRDVEAFEKTCGAVDPDATTAFKALLAVDKTAAPVAAAPSVPKVQRSETVTKEPVRKAEPRPQTPAARQPAPAAAPAIAEPVHRDPAISDTQWLDAVREALVTHKDETRAPAPKPAHTPDAAKLQSAPAPAARPAPRDPVLSPPAAIAVTPGTAPAPAPAPVAAPAEAPAMRPASPEAASSPPPVNVVAPAVGPSAAPALPPAIAIAPPPVAVQATDNHPVPPESIPDSAPPANAAKPDEHGRSRIGKWISTIPLLGPAVDNARQ